MKKTLLNKTVSILLILIIISGLFPVNLFSQPFSVSSLNEIKGFNGSVLDSHFSRADRELNPERWLAAAKDGITQAVRAWELTAGKIYDNPVLFNEAKINLEKLSGEELEKRFSKWLLGRFFGEAAENTIKEFLLTFDETQKYYSWHLDDSGNVVFDDITGDPMIIRPNEEGREFSRDLRIWQNEAKNIINAKADTFDNFLIRMYPELISYIPAELRETTEEIIKNAASVKTSAIKQEFENLAAREESIFYNRRTRDILSLRKKSEEQSARIYTEKLIAETEETCADGIEKLKSRIEQAAAGTGDLAVLGEEWLQLYKEQFDRGIKAWEEAEERFFIRRLEWEQDSFRLYSEGEETWHTAFRQFEEERQKWELNARELFLAGEMMFINLSDDFQRNITEARKEFELNMEMRIGEGTAKIKAAIDMYLICSSAAISAMDNVKFWHSQYTASGKVNPESSGFSAWLSKEMEKKPYNNVLQEMQKAFNMHSSYMNKALDARNKINSDYAELLGTGMLKDILLPDASSEDFCLDEYQIALIRAKALVLYWERKTEIAEAVKKYADELSAGRMTESEGIRAWDEAKKAYNESLAAYEIELKKLYETGDDINNQQEILYKLSLQMQVEEEKLNLLNREYTDFVSAFAVNRSDYLLNEFNEKYNYISREYKKLYSVEQDQDYIKVFEYGMMWWIANQKEAGIDFDEQEEIWSITSNSLSLLFNSYGFENENFMLPDIISLCETIFLIPGCFTRNFAEFLQDFDSCLYIVPSWLDAEITDWKSALIQYITAYALNNDILPEMNSSQLVLEQEKLMDEYNYLYSLALYIENEGGSVTDEFIDLFLDTRKKILELYYTAQITFDLENNYEIISSGNAEHWRQFLNEDYIFEYDDSLVFIESYQEGILADALAVTVYFSKRINDSFLINSRRALYEIEGDAEYFLTLYNEELSKLYSAPELLKSLYFDLTETSKAYKLSLTLPKEVEKQKLLIENKIAAQNSVYTAMLNEYLKEAEKFLQIGYQYDVQYSLLNDAYERSDQKRFEYEKQDAIKRWASTAYLNADNSELPAAKEKLSRAQTVLNVLSDLYNKEKNRTYINPEYDALYAAYEQSFSRKLLVLEAAQTVKQSAAQEYSNNADIFNNYQNALGQLGHIGYISRDYENYTSPSSRASWSVKDIITVKNGRIVFSRASDSSMILTGITEEKAYELDVFFNAKNTSDNEKNKISLYDEALRGLSQRMSGYFTDSSKYRTWSLARDYLIKSLIESNGDLGFLKNYFSGEGQLKEKGSLNSIIIKNNILPGVQTLGPQMKFVIDFQDVFFKIAWDSLSETEKADLEFYVILTLTGNSQEYFYGFTQYYTYDIYNNAYNYVYDKYKEAKNITDAWFAFPISWAWNEMRDVNGKAVMEISGPLLETKRNRDKWVSGLRTNLSSIAKLASDYEKSNKKIMALEGIKTSGSNVEWADINQALTLTGKFNAGEINRIKSYWDAMNSHSSAVFSKIEDALLSLLDWTDSEEKKSKSDLDKLWTAELKKQKENEIDFYSAVEMFIDGTSGLDVLQTAAYSAYGENAAAWKNHGNNLQKAMLRDISLYLTADFNFYNVFSGVGNNLISLAENTLENKYSAELAVREAEWNRTLTDIMEKYYAWQESAALILENGRTDWIAGLQKMEQAYKQWNANFQREYERVNYEWQEAYLAGLEDKEKWLQQAANAADRASSEALLSLVGTEGERLSRFIDTREPFGIRGTETQAQDLMAELFQSSGITGMSAAFGSFNGIAGTASSLARAGIGGAFAWDSAFIKMSASDLARKSNAEIADNEARILAYNVRLNVDETVKNLIANVDSANQNFRAGMDEHFIFNGLWRRNGNNYEKEIIKGSTLFSPVISETVLITGYKNFKMDPVILKTNLNEDHLTNLNSIAIRNLMDNAINEIYEIAKGIFGTGENPVSVGGSNGERTQSPGLFGAYIGYIPDVKELKEFTDKRGEIFKDTGRGELGRLMTEYIYWSIIHSKGNGELSLASWDKRMWDDDGSWFKAPSLRTIGTIAGSIAAGVLSGGAGFAGIVLTIAASSASDIVFGSLDAAFGFKTWDEAAFGIGKSILTNTVSSLASGLFNGFSAFDGVLGANKLVGPQLTSTLMNTTNSTFLKAGIQVGMAGVQTLTTGFASSLISGITYDSVNKFGYSTDIFMEGMSNVFRNTLTTVASAVTSTGLKAINSGLDMEKIIGFNQLNKSDLNNLNNLLGSLAGQGVNYALGGDFTLNVFDWNFGNYNSGLLELRFGGDGVSMNFGTGGANVSIGNLSSALRGAAVWNVNNRIFDYGKRENFNALVALRAQYGYGDARQKDQLFDILSGDVILNTGADGDYYAQTTLVNDQRVINLAGYKDGMSSEDQFRLAVILGHEAYRDGYAANDNYLETRTATLAHTEMARRMILGHESIAYDQNLMNDLLAYQAALDANDMSIFNSYIDGNYDSSADYWKLVKNAENLYGFEWDNKLEFDLSIIGRDIDLSSLSEEDLEAIWKAGVGFSGYDTFKTAVSAFGALNSAIDGFENIFKLPDNEAPSKDKFDDHWNSFKIALQAVGDSGFLVQSAAEILNIGDGKIFAAGGGYVSSYYGIREMDNEFKEHNALDLFTVSDDNRLVAAISGSLNITFTTGGGIWLNINGDDEERLSYAHSAASSIRNFVGLYATDGIYMINGELSGVAQNMVIGMMGNTGTHTTGAHVHLEHWIDKSVQDPAKILNLNNFGVTDYATKMSGFSGTTDNVNLSRADVLGIYQYMSTDSLYHDKFPGNFNKLASNGNNSLLFNEMYFFKQNIVSRVSSYHRMEVEY